jgi:hypothetical protein
MLKKNPEAIVIAIEIIPGTTRKKPVTDPPRSLHYSVPTVVPPSFLHAQLGWALPSMRVFMWDPVM